MYAIWCAARTGYYHPDHEGCVPLERATLWDDIGEAGMVCDQLCERDRWVTVTVGQQGLVRLGERPWEVVEG